MYSSRKVGVFCMTGDRGTSVPVKDKFALDVTEASEYFGIGERKLRQIINENLDSGLVIRNGVKYLIKRRQFEQFLEPRTSV